MGVEGELSPAHQPKRTRASRHGPSTLLDTNVLVTATASRREWHAAAQRVLGWPTLGRPTYVSGQILREYMAVATRPPESNGLGLSSADAAANVAAFRALMPSLSEDAQVQAQLAELVVTCECKGVAIHDANVVATALAHGVQAIVTESLADFRRFSHLVEVLPLAAVA